MIRRWRCQTEGFGRRPLAPVFLVAAPFVFVQNSDRREIALGNGYSLMLLLSISAFVSLSGKLILSTLGA
jgi:hypothetical protein